MLLVDVVKQKYWVLQTAHFPAEGLLLWGHVLKFIIGVFYVPTGYLRGEAEYHYFIAATFCFCKT